jgi:hypothetical protein
MQALTRVWQKHPDSVKADCQTFILLLAAGRLDTQTHARRSLGGVDASLSAVAQLGFTSREGAGRPVVKAPERRCG